MINRLLKRMRWADNSIFEGFLKAIYFNIFKVNRFVIHVLHLSETEIEKPSLNPREFEFKVVDHVSLKQYVSKVSDANMPREFYMYEIDGVNLCAIITRNDKIAWFDWIYLEGDKSRCFNIGRHECQTNYAFTFPDSRNLGLNRQGHLYMYQWLKERGITKILHATHEGTLYQLKSLRKIGALKEVGLLKQWFIFRPKFKAR